MLSSVVQGHHRWRQSLCDLALLDYPPRCTIFNDRFQPIIQTRIQGSPEYHDQVPNTYKRLSSSSTLRNAPGWYC